MSDELSLSNFPYTFPHNHTPPYAIDEQGRLTTAAPFSDIALSQPTSTPFDFNNNASAVKSNESHSCDNRAPSDAKNHIKERSIKKERAVCKTCGKSFSRVPDLKRHAQKHDPLELKFLCGVKGCDYGGCYRPDKMGSHIKNRHMNGKKHLGILVFKEHYRYIFPEPGYCFPASGDCLLSTGFLEALAATGASEVNCRHYPSFRCFTLAELLTTDGKGLKKMDADGRVASD